MQYKGKLYGKVGRQYIPLAIDSDEVDRLQERKKKCPTIGDAEYLEIAAQQEIETAARASKTKTI